MTAMPRIPAMSVRKTDRSRVGFTAFSDTSEATDADVRVDERLDNRPEDEESLIETDTRTPINQVTLQSNSLAVIRKTQEEPGCAKLATLKSAFYYIPLPTS